MKYCTQSNMHKYVTVLPLIILLLLTILYRYCFAKMFFLCNKNSHIHAVYYLVTMPISNAAYVLIQEKLS